MKFTKKGKRHKKACEKKKLQFENYKNSLEVIQLENKINYPEKNEIKTDNLKRYHKQFIRNNKLILKTQQRFKSDRHNVFLKKLIILNNDNDKRMQPIDSIVPYT